MVYFAIMLFLIIFALSVVGVTFLVIKSKLAAEIFIIFTIIMLAIVIIYAISLIPKLLLFWSLLYKLLIT